MHIPDGFLDPITSIVTYIVSIIALSLSFTKARKSFREEYVPLVGVLSGSVFVAQLLDWPIPGGTTAHFVGSALVSIIAGPYIGVIVMFIVLFFQALLFQDGGLTTLGANTLNMAVIGCFVGYGVFKFSKMFLNERRVFLSSFLAGWASVTMAAIACGFEIGFSTQFAYGVLIAVPIMGISHALLGILEGLITAFAVEYIRNSRPDIVYSI